MKKWNLCEKSQPFGLGGLKRKSLQRDDLKFWDLDKKEKTLQKADFSSVWLVGFEVIVVFFI